MVCPGPHYFVHCNMAISVAVLLPFLGVSSLNFGPLFGAALFLCALLQKASQVGKHYSHRLTVELVGRLRCSAQAILSGQIGLFLDEGSSRRDVPRRMGSNPPIIDPIPRTTHEAAKSRAA